MAHAYTPGLKVTTNIKLRKERRLPLKGDVIVKIGDNVSADDIVARTELPGDVETINLAGKLGVMPNELKQFMKKNEGDPILKGEIIAKSSGFFGLFKKGRKWVLHFIFNVREIEEKYKNRLDVKIAAGGLLISIMAILIGVVISIIQDTLVAPDPNSPLSAFLASFLTGNWILLAGIGLFAVLAIILFMIYFWKNGYYLILRIMGKLEK